MSDVKITGVEAHFLLFALDDYLGVDAKGHVMSAKHEYTREALQSLRDRLFAAHQHPLDESQLKIARKVMRKRRGALAQLAK